MIGGSGALVALLEIRIRFVDISRYRNIYLDTTATDHSLESNVIRNLGWNPRRNQYMTDP